MDWTRAAAPTLAEFDALARAAFASLPGAFRARCGDVVIQVEDFADAEILQDLGVEDPFELTGLYQGVDLTEKSVSHPSPTPDLIFLYRRPLLDEWADHGEVTLGELIAHVLVHEIGHHFGLSDDEMHRIEDQAEAE